MPDVDLLDPRVLVQDSLDEGVMVDHPVVIVDLRKGGNREVKPVACSVASAILPDASSPAETLDLRQRFWFGIPKRLQPGDLRKLKSAGALVIPAINTFR